MRRTGSRRRRQSNPARPAPSAPCNFRSSLTFDINSAATARFGSKPVSARNAAPRPLTERRRSASPAPTFPLQPPHLPSPALARKMKAPRLLPNRGATVFAYSIERKRTWQVCASPPRPATHMPIIAIINSQVIRSISLRRSFTRLV
jgi:hypothetical protein